MSFYFFLQLFRQPSLENFFKIYNIVLLGRRQRTKIIFKVHMHIILNKIESK